jgi:hypothetical protein
MYSLRRINNHYKDFAGQRCDFIVTGDPTFQIGRAGCDGGLPEVWDTTPPLAAPGFHLARKRSVKKLVRDLTELDPWMPLQQKVLSRSASSPSKARSQPNASNSRGFEAFISELVNDSGLPSCGFARASAGCARDVDRLNEELADLRRRMRCDPEATKKSLKEKDSWRYYDLHLRQANKLNGMCRREAPNALRYADKARAKSMTEIPEHRRGCHVTLA